MCPKSPANDLRGHVLCANAINSKTLTFFFSNMSGVMQKILDASWSRATKS